MSGKTYVSVRIYGHDYTFTGTESEEYIQKVCYNVDKKMRDFRQRDPKLNETKLAILTAVNTADEFFKNKALLDETIADLKKYKEEAFNAKNKLLVTEKENEYLKEEIQSLKIELAKYRNSCAGRRL